VVRGVGGCCVGVLGRAWFDGMFVGLISLRVHYAGADAASMDIYQPILMILETKCSF
jgi:hypothetical protein